MPDCLFCRIVAGEVPADRVAETDGALAFRDINPQAPTHVLVIPKEHFDNAAHLSRHDADLLAEVFTLAAQVAEDEGVAEAGYRLPAKTGGAPRPALPPPPRSPPRRPARPPPARSRSRRSFDGLAPRLTGCRIEPGDGDQVERDPSHHAHRR